MIQTYLKKEKQIQFCAIAKALGVSEYKLLQLVVDEFLEHPTYFVTKMQISLKKHVKV